MELQTELFKMDPLEKLHDRQLLEFFGRNKTVMSCMDKPQTFLNQLRDNKLILEEKYEEMIRIKSIDEMKEKLYNFLRWIEEKQPQNIRLFCTCVFKDFMMTQYPTLKQLRDSLIDVPATSDSKEETEEEEVEEEELQANPNEEVCMEDEVEPQGDDSSTQRSDKGSPPNRENVEIWTLPLYRLQLPVTCGDKEGTLYRNKLAKGEPCIRHSRSKKLLRPFEFEKLCGKHSSRNWRQSIRCNGTPLKELLKHGNLTCPANNKSKANKSTLPCSSNTGETEEEEEEEEGLQANPDEEEVTMEDEVEPQGDDSSTQRSDTDQGDNPEEVTDERPRVGQNVFRVTCGALSGMLHKIRFTSGRCGNSIRTEDRWLSPVEFVEQGSAMPNALWRRDIHWEGQPLSTLIERKMLHLHSEQCFCRLCHPDPQALEEQKNDDYCFVCGSGGKLGLCDHCPRSFHPECHLPRVDPSILGDHSAWMCTFCIWNMNEYLSQMTNEETRMHPVSNHMLQCHYLLLSLYNADKDRIFAKDPCIHVRGYSSQILTPMWLDKITEQLLDQQYTVGQLLTDIQLIFSNCDKFNQNKPEFRDMGIKLKEFYEQEVEKVFRRQ